MKTSDVNYGDLGQEHLEKIDRFRRSRETSVLVVMFTDLKGSTQIAEERGERYTQRMRHVHDEMLLEIIERDGHGLYIKNIGDSIMCIFSEPSMAVKRALEIQQRLHDYNRTNPNEEPMLVRIGMHMGQVAVEDQMQLDIFGRHVNRAARVESLADGGQILLTHGVYDSARGWVEGEHILWVDHGEYLLKGISEPVRIYEVADPEMTLPKPPRGTRHVPAVHRWLVRGGIVAACLILGLSVLLWMTWKGRRVGVLEGRPVIAVMYFTNLTGNETEDILCAGMAETLITDLTHINGLAVVPRGQVLRYARTSVSAVQVGQKLGARVVLEGSLQRAGSRIRVNTQLVDVSSGLHLWAERFDQAMEDLLALQDAISSRVVQALKVELSAAEASVLKEPATRNLDAYQLFSRGIYYLDAGMLDQALESFGRALSQDPSYTLAAFWKGQTFERMERWGEALAVYQGILPESGKEERVRWQWKYPEEVPEEARGSTRAPDGTIYLFESRKDGKTSYSVFDPAKRQVSLKFEAPVVFPHGHYWIGKDLMVAGYIGGEEGKKKLLVYGLERNSGQMRWRFCPPEYERFGFQGLSLGVRNQTLSVLDPMVGREISILDGPSGRRLWTYPIKPDKQPYFVHRAEPPGHPPVILIWRRFGSTLEGRREQTGEVLWRRDLQGDLMSVDVKGDRVNVLTPWGAHRIDARSGDILWSREIPAMVRQDPASGRFFASVYFHNQDLLCLAAADGTVYGIDLKHGKVRWQVEAGKELAFNRLYFIEQEKSGFLHKNAMFLTSREGDLLGIDIERGKIALRSKIGEGDLKVDCASDTLLFVRSGRTIYGLERPSGAVRWRYDGARDVPFLWAFQNRVFFPSDEEALSVLDAGDGARLWTYLTRPAAKDEEGEEELKRPYRLIFREGMPFLIDRFGVVELNVEGLSKGQAVMEKQILDRIAQCHRAQGDLKQALTVAERVAQKVAPGFPDIHRTLGEIHQDMGHEAEALDAYMTYYSLIDVGRDQAREFLNRLKDRAGLLWKRDLKMSTFIPVFRVRRDSLVVASGNQGSRTSVYGLNARDGSILWEQRTGGHVALSQIMADGSVIGISQEDPDKTVAAWRLNMENGQRIWTRAIASPVKGAAYWFSEPLLLCDRAYMAVNRWKGRETVSQYLCLDLDGNVLWQQSESTALSPLADAGYRNLGAGTDALVVGWKDTLRAYNLDSGKVLWTETLPSSSVPDFVTDGNLLFFRTMDHQANAFDIATCRLLWRCPLPDARRSLPKSRIYSEAANCLGDNRMLTWDNEKLYMLSVTKGATREAPIWTYPLPKPLVTPPRIKDGAVYALLSDNTLLALDAGSGKERLRRSLLWKAQNFDVAGDVVFLLSEDSDLYALSLMGHP